MAKIRNPISFAENFGLEPAELRARGVFNPMLNVDTKLFIDPVLLNRSRHPEMSVAAKTFRTHFGDVVKLLAASTMPGDVAWRAARQLFAATEIPSTCLGYGSASIRGRAIGDGLRERILSTAKEIVDLGVTDPDMFMLLPLLEDNIGPDRISDLTTNVILHDLAKFTERASNDLAVPTEAFEFDGVVFKLPVNPFQATRTPVLLVPTDVLRALPVASDWREVADAAAHNASLRSRVNKLIGNIWSAKIRKERKRLRAAALSSKAAFESLLSMIHDGIVEGYNLERDPKGLMAWRDIHQTIAQDYPLRMRLAEPPGPDAAIELVKLIVDQFRFLVEQKGLWKLLWHDGKPHGEKVAQMLFFAIADSYCKLNDLDVTPEAETGSGPVDFKFSRGYKIRVIVEIKLSTNQKLVRGYERQLETYRQAEGPISSMYLIVDVGGMGKKEQQLEDARAKAPPPQPAIEVVDARRRKSASKR